MLDNKTVTFLKSVIFRYIDKNRDKAFIFGSRADGKPLKFSDIDIGIAASRKLPLTLLSDIKEEFEKSDLPYTVDIVDFSKVSSKFENVAKKNIISLN